MFKLCKEDRLRREELRGNYPQGLRWYGVMTHWGQENRVRAEVESGFLGSELAEVLLPDLVVPQKSKKKSVRLFGGYVFLHAQMTDEFYMRVSSYPQVLQILGLGYRIPSAIDDQEMAHLRSVLEFRPAPQMVARGQVGQMVRVVSGLLRGMTGRVLQINSRHVKIETSFSFLGLESGIAVALPPSQVEFISPVKSLNYSHGWTTSAPSLFEGVGST